jgi:hypothetical protein
VNQHGLTNVSRIMFSISFGVENIEIREELIGFRHAKSIRGERIADIIVQFLNEVHLDIRNVRAQCYDGAANMAGKYNVSRIMFSISIGVQSLPERSDYQLIRPKMLSIVLRSNRS